MHPTRVTLCLIVGATLLRLAMAAVAWLSIDESYMVAAGRHLHLGYFDHPPVAWWLSRGAALLFGSEQPPVVRLPFILLFALSTWLTYALGRLAASPAGGLWAAVALNLAPVVGITSGGWVLPDGPLICCLLGAGYCLMRALPGRGWGWWLGAGACLGLALQSKYSAVLTALGALLAILTAPQHRRWLLRPQPWAAVALALALFAPVIAWNASHDWVSFAFQGSRAFAHKFRPLGPVAVLGGAALFLLPWIWFGLVVSLVRGLRAGPAEWRGWLLCWLALPPIVLFAVVALWSRHVLFHWAVPGYLFLFPLFGAGLDALARRRPVLLRRSAIATVALVALGLSATGAELRWHWLRVFAPAFDPTLQMLDWTPLRQELAERGLLERPGTAIAGTSWWVTGKLAYALGEAHPVWCFNVDCREFAASNDFRPAAGTDVLLLAPKLNAKALADYGAWFDSVVVLEPLVMRFPNRPAAAMPIVLGRHLKAWP